MKFSDDITNHYKRLSDVQKKALKRLGILTIRDLLYHFPVRYGNTTIAKRIEDVIGNETVEIYGTIDRIKTGKTYKTKMPFAEATLSDETGSVTLKWFHQPYIAKLIKQKSIVKISGKSTENKSGKISFLNPHIETVKKVPIAVGDSLFTEEDLNLGLPIYPESRGVTSTWIYHAIQKCFQAGILDSIIDPIPKDILVKYNLPSLRTSLIWIHGPRKIDDSNSAKKRFSFEEIFLIQIKKSQERKLYESSPTFVIDTSKSDIKSFVDRFPFQATDAQLRAIEEISSDFRRGHAMSRLLEGDVGSGKTAVAAATAFAAITTPPPDNKYANLQVAYMAPTEILATQQFENFITYFAYLGIQVGLITGSGCQKFPSKVNPEKPTKISKTQLLRWVANGEIPILIGTHALISKNVTFKNLAYTIIDEQHKFGTKQRQKLRNKDEIIPHLLSMTATPIPRTLALTLYGDLDLTLLDTLPKGRKKVKTKIVPTKDRNDMYEEIRERIKEGRQMYVICPRIDEPDPDKQTALQTASVVAESQRLKEKIFPEFEIGLLHGKMKPKDKDAAMKDFESNNTQILVSTSVVEVGVNVPNATMIILEGAERFGLAQLHQLRGRVARSTHDSFCYVFTDSETTKTLERLDALVKAKNGFELAEYDLAQRGAGQLSGIKQWGVSDMAMEAIRNIKMVEAARKEARDIVDKDSELIDLPILRAELDIRTQGLHME
jgi:ATP-dependent DNA helicase RecG